MNNIVISTNKLGKCYTIGHKRQKNNTALSEIISNSTKQFFSRILNPQHYAHNETEEFWALKNVNIEVTKGDRVGIIGRNGAGKSTLLKLLSRITAPSTGRIKIKGRVASLLEVGTGFHHELTGRENIYLNGAILGMTRKEVKQKFDEIVDFAETEQFLDTPVKRYSSGMYMRLAFAVAAHLQPEILVIDEVLAVGDTSFQKKCLGKMEDIGNTGRTIIFVSHNLGSIQKLCNKAILLHKGELISSGGVIDVINNYMNNTRTDNNEKKLKYIRRNGSLGEKIIITKCSVYNSMRNITNNFKFGENFYVEIECISSINIKNLQFVIGINSSTGYRIATIPSYDGEKSFNMMVNETKKGTLKVELMLTPGAYTLTVGIRDQFTGYDQLQDVRLITIDEIRDNKILNDPYIPYGLVHLPNPKWHIS